MPTGTISALRAQEHDPQRVNVFIGGDFAIGVSLNTLASEGLFVGKVIDEDDWAALERAERHDKTLQAALRALDTRPRSIAELRDRLQRKEFPPEAIDAAITRLADLGLVNDAEFARFWIENRQISRPRGAMALRDELRRKGVSNDVIAAAITELVPAADDLERAMISARAVLPRYIAAADRLSFQRRLGGYLERRGFSFTTIRPVIDTLWAEVRASSPNDDIDE
jgi:regulatory protein